MANGQSNKQICDWLNEEGVRVSTKALPVYLRRIRQQRSSTTGAESVNPVQAIKSERQHEGPSKPSHANTPADPLANLRERQQNRPGFNFDPEIKPEKLI
jgi:hypothetical protein